MVKAFPLSPLERIARKAGAERVSTKAINIMRDIFLEIADEIAIKSIAATHHAKRVTVKKDDILIATR